MTNEVIETRHVTPCAHGEIYFCANRLSRQGDGALWCMKWRLQRDRTTPRYGCMEGYDL